MTKNLERRKYKLIQEIIGIDDEAAVARLEGQIKAIQEEDSIWQAAIQPMRKTITLEEMKEEQQYAPIDEKTFFELAEQINIEESIEDLLAMLD